MICGSVFGRVAAALVAAFLALCPASVAPAATAGPKVTVVSFGLFGDQGVFEREARGAARIVADRFGAGAVIVRANTRSRADATVETLAVALQATAAGMDAENDILVLILTSHGSRAGLAVKAGNRLELLSPSVLAAMLDRAGARRRVVIVSACYSGIFIRPLANADTLVITAADADHPSFGCRDRARWTYFGDAFFNVALRRATNLRDAFVLARTLVRTRERRHGFAASNPQMAGGENIERLLQADLRASGAAAVEDLAQVGDVLGERAAASRAHAHARLRLAPLEAFLDRDVARLLQRLQVGAEVAVGRAHQPLEPGELDRRAARRQRVERRHDLQPHGLVNDVIAVAHRATPLLPSQMPPMMSVPLCTVAIHSRSQGSAWR